MEKMTLWEMCERTCDAISGSPLNYYQGRWATDAKAMFKVRGMTAFADEACGTAYCRAGHMLSIAKNSHVTDETEISYQARHMLQKAGISPAAIGMLFWGGACNNAGKPGSAAYVAEGVNGLKRFMTEWEIQLKGHYTTGEKVEEGNGKS